MYPEVRFQNRNRELSGMGSSLSEKARSLRTYYLLGAVTGCAQRSLPSFVITVAGVLPLARQYDTAAAQRG